MWKAKNPSSHITSSTTNSVRNIEISFVRSEFFRTLYVTGIWWLDHILTTLRALVSTCMAEMQTRDAAQRRRSGYWQDLHSSASLYVTAPKQESKQALGSCAGPSRVSA